MKIGNVWMEIGLAILVGSAGCGDGGKKQPASYADISSSFAHPTGTLAATNADAVAQAYQASLSSGLGTAGTLGALTAAKRLAKPATTEVNATEGALQSTTSAATASQSVACPYGGSISVSVNNVAPGATSFSETFNYNNCCESAGCCLDGGGDLFYSQAGSFCESFSVTGTCSTVPVSVDYAICEDTTTGMLNYLVELQGQSFAVSGTYNDGTGTLMITGNNGTFTCRYTNHTGTCSGTAGTFAF